MSYILLHCNCLDWFETAEPASVHAVITDPPFGLLEYRKDQIEKMKNGKGGVWRIPPTIGGSQRKPLPRFTVLNHKERYTLREFFSVVARGLLKVLVPGGHVFIAGNPLLIHLVFQAFDDAGFEIRGQIIRLVRTFRGGDRPKGAHEQYPEICSMPRGCYEPWGLFRKPLEYPLKLHENLAKWKAGGLRRPLPDVPFTDIIESERTPEAERTIAPHPSLKPQRFLRQLAYAALPLGEGTVLDPFAGSGSTIAACEVLHVDSIGIEINDEYTALAQTAIPRLASLPYDQDSNGIFVKSEPLRISPDQMTLFHELAENR